MKKLIIILLLLPLFIKAQCPDKGDSKDLKDQAASILKNREAKCDIPPAKYDAETFLAIAPDPHNNNPQWIELETYIIGVKWAGLESSECHSKDTSNLDLHIETGPLPNSPKTEYIICEVTGKNRKANPHLNIKYIRALIGKKVSIIGWRFYDTEHENASEQIKSRPHNWRGTCLECHSIQSITLIK